VTATVLDGKKLAAQLRSQLAEQVAAWSSQHRVVPTLAAVLVGEDPASRVYVGKKQRACRKAGLESRLVELPQHTPQERLLEVIAELNADRAVHGILVQLPLPEHIDTQVVLRHVDPQKDVDGFHPENVGLLVQGTPRFVPCTPAGILRLLHHYKIPTAGRHVVVLGRSQIVGKPLANLLLQRGAGGDATVTVCHSRTPDLARFTRQAEILVAAVGRPGMVGAEMLRPGVVVVDVGINRTEQGLVGDVDFASVKQVASYLTPVPGGVGPLTVAMLLWNTFQAAQLQVEGKITAGPLPGEDAPCPENADSPWAS